MLTRALELGCKNEKSLYHADKIDSFDWQIRYLPGDALVLLNRQKYNLQKGQNVNMSDIFLGELKLVVKVVYHNKLYFPLLETSAKHNFPI